ncbi:MAG: choice-of-anchor tandem repeat GloVer-containing protein [Bryobacteraceae bacterium]
MGTLRVSSICAGVLATSLTLSAQTYTSIYSFGASPDGANPHRAVAITSGGTLYGTTVYGGSSGDGTIYELVPGGGGSWTESVIHSFTETSGDGGEPDGDLYWNGTAIYGTTSIGGTSSDGTVFRAKETSGVWSETPIYTFTGGSDGAGPFAGVIPNGGVLYGTTFYGGGSTYCTGGCGTAYSLTALRLVVERGRAIRLRRECQRRAEPARTFWFMPAMASTMAQPITGALRATAPFMN